MLLWSRVKVDENGQNPTPRQNVSVLVLVWQFVMLFVGVMAGLFGAGLLLFDLLFFQNWVTMIFAGVLLGIAFFSIRFSIRGPR